jgi:hypothetical protein
MHRGEPHVGLAVGQPRATRRPSLRTARRAHPTTVYRLVNATRRPPRGVSPIPRPSTTFVPSLSLSLRPASHLPPSVRAEQSRPAIAAAAWSSAAGRDSPSSVSPSPIPRMGSIPSSSSTSSPPNPAFPLAVQGRRRAPPPAAARRRRAASPSPLLAVRFVG